MAAESEGAAAPPPSPREASKVDQCTGTSLHSRAALQRIFEKYGGDQAQSRKLKAVLESAAPRALPRERPSQTNAAWARFRSEPLAGGVRRGPGLGPEVLNRLTSEVPGSTLTPYGVGVLESEADDRGMVRVRFPWGRAEIRAKDATRERRALLRRSLEALSSLLVVLIKALGALAPGDIDSDSDESDEDADMVHTSQGLATMKGLVAWLEEAATHPQPTHREELLDLALLLSVVVRTRAELLRLDGISTHPQLQAELLAADALRIHLGLLERLGRVPVAPGGLAETCRVWSQVLQRFGAESGLPGGAWRLVRPGAKVVDPLSEEELLASLPTSRQPTRFVRDAREITSVKVTAGPVLRGPPRTTVVRCASMRSPSPIISHTVTNTVWSPAPCLPATAVFPALPAGRGASLSLPSRAPEVVRRASTPLPQTFRTSGDTATAPPFAPVPRFHSGDFPLPPSPLSFFGPRIATTATAATSQNPSVPDTPDACATPLPQEMQEVLEERAEQESGSSSEISPQNASQTPSSQGRQSPERRRTSVRQRVDPMRARAPSPVKEALKSESPVVRVVSERTASAATAATKSRKVVWR
ncbi:unnamed protein product [Symbiodinium natans]|uniref:Uncharacterized protein n=1 Tax=Symbiodinium natans TaxID=878477 RepID=A0A812TYQ1_9DINO|nr:unnamed protein product [Symbiodinium natans]